MKMFCDTCGEECFSPTRKNGACSEQSNCITQDGIRLLLCDSCQRIQMRHHPRNVPLEISLHACLRFNERCSRLRGNPQSTEQIIRRMYWTSRPIIFTDEYMRERWVSGGDADYYLWGEYLLVVTSTKPFNVKTIESIGEKILGVDYWFMIAEKRDCLCA